MILVLRISTPGHVWRKPGQGPHLTLFWDVIKDTSTRVIDPVRPTFHVSRRGMPDVPCASGKPNSERSKKREAGTPRHLLAVHSQILLHLIFLILAQVGRRRCIPESCGIIEGGGTRWYKNGLVHVSYLCV